MEDIKERRKKRKNYQIAKEKIEIITDEIEIITDEEDDNCEIIKKKNRKLNKGEKIFLVFNILIIIAIIMYYGYRTLYYYKREHKVEEKITLKDKITNIKNVTYKNDGLYEKDNYFYYKGKNVNNYLYYSGRLFRIISIDKNIKVIEENVVTNLTYGLTEKFDKSLIHDWLKDYLETYKDYEMYLSKNKWCNQEIDINKYDCKNFIEDYIGLITTKEYLDAGGVDSYLNNNSYYWTINYADSNAYFINNTGNINNYVKDNNGNYFSYGIRPTTVISGDQLYLNGDGTKDNPYVIEEFSPSILKNSSVGSFCLYNGMKYRIMNIDDAGVSMILNDNLEVEKQYDAAIKYLNNEFIKDFNKDELVKQESIINVYNQDNKYNYKEKVKSENMYVIMPKIGDLFINSADNYWLNTLSDKKVNAYYIMDNSMFFGDLKNKVHAVKPIIKLKGDLIIKNGKGTIDVPYVLE